MQIKNRIKHINDKLEIFNPDKSPEIMQFIREDHGFCMACFPDRKKFEDRWQSTIKWSIVEGVTHWLRDDRKVTGELITECPFFKECDQHKCATG